MNDYIRAQLQAYHQSKNLKLTARIITFTGFYIFKNLQRSLIIFKDIIIHGKAVSVKAMSVIIMSEKIIPIHASQSASLKTLTTDV